MQQCKELFRSGHIDGNWMCCDWWHALLNLYSYRQQQCENSFRIHWVPAHKLEGVPDQLMTDELALAAGTTNTLYTTEEQTLLQKSWPTDSHLLIANSRCRSIGKFVDTTSGWLTSTDYFLHMPNMKMLPPLVLPSVPIKSRQNSVRPDFPSGCGG